MNGGAKVPSGPFRGRLELGRQSLSGARPYGGSTITRWGARPRDQSVDAEQQIRFASLFGTVVDETHTGSFHGFVSNRRPDGATPPESFLPWHSDYAWTPRPDSALSLYGLELSGDMASTWFANTVTGLAALGPELRERIDGRRGLLLVDLSQYGSVEPSAVVPEVGPDGDSHFPDDEYNYPRIFHPLVYRHPRTGEDLLLAQEWYSVLVEGCPYAETQELHRALFDVLYDPTNTYEHHWRVGDLIVWDNLALQRGRPALRNTESGVRTLRRVVIHDAYEEVMAFTRKVSDLADATQARASPGDPGTLDAARRFVGIV